MARRNKIGLIALLVALVTVLSTTVASAQEGSNDKVVLGQEYVLRSGEVLPGRLTVIGGTATLEENSTVNGDVLVVGGTLSASGNVNGNVVIWGGSVSLNDTAVVRGNLATFGGALHRSSGAKVLGQTVESFGAPPVLQPALPEVPALPETPQHVAPADGGGLFSGIRAFVKWQLDTIGWALLMALFGIVAVLLFPRRLELVATTVSQEPALSFGLGILTFAAAALAGGVLLIACGLGVLVWLAALLALVLGWSAIGLWLGQRGLQLFKIQTASSLLEVALGVFAITVIARLPLCIGYLFVVVVGSAGLGAVVLTRFGGEPYHRMSRPPAGPSPAPSPSGMPRPATPPQPEPANEQPGSGQQDAPATGGTADAAADETPLAPWATVSPDRSPDVQESDLGHVAAEGDTGRDL